MDISATRFTVEPALDVAGSTGTLRISLSALKRNYSKLRTIPAHGRIGAVVKANAYGLGAEEVSKALHQEGCRDFFVAQFSEAISLRSALASNAQIFVLNGILPGAERLCAEAGIIPVINSIEQFKNWSLVAKHLGRKLPAVVQFDTGMSRLGIPASQHGRIASMLEEEGNLDVLFIMSHLASADDPASEQNADQLAAMLAISETFRGIDTSFANSGGIFLGQAYHGALARSGLALYGGAPSAKGVGDMERVVSLEVAVVQTRTVPAGTRVGYSAAHVTSRPLRLATIAAGYADGLPRSLSDRGAAYFQGSRLPIVGRVSMDSVTLDVTTLPEGTLQLGSQVEILGPHQSLEDLATDAGTISYEILTSLGERYHREYV